MAQLAPDEVILGLLKASPTHGYDLLDTFRDRAHLGRVWRMSTSQLYAVLKRLEESGLIVGRSLPQPDAPVRVEYALTAEGEDRLHTWLYDTPPPTSIHRIRVLFLSRLYITTLLNLPPEPMITRQIAACQTQLAVHQTALAQTTAPMESLTLTFMISQLEAALAWLNLCYKEPLILRSLLHHPTN